MTARVRARRRSVNAPCSCPKEGGRSPRSAGRTRLDPATASRRATAGGCERQRPVSAPAPSQAAPRVSDAAGPAGRRRHGRCEGVPPRAPPPRRRAGLPALPVLALARCAPGGPPDSCHARKGAGRVKGTVARALRAAAPAPLPLTRPAPSATCPAAVAQSSVVRSLSALPITDTDERLMASAAIIGDSSRPMNG